jgi:pyruvate kinase
VRRAKIVCTLGPATHSKEQIRALADAGMNVARMNFSHGAYEDHLARFEAVRAVEEDIGRPIAILADLQGPKIRLGIFANGREELEDGATFTITTEDIEGDVTICSTTYKGLPSDVEPGDPLLIDDGNIRLEVDHVDGPRVVTKVINGGPVSNKKGINIPSAAVDVPALSPKDEEDLRWALQHGADIVALSFVRSSDDVTGVHAIMDEVGITVPVIAKIEKPQAVADLAGILNGFDGIMVARGDLGVELPLWEVPVVQKRAVEMARRLAKPVIVATQMLESMISNPRPTRAEASDVANAVLDGADAVMLSGETSVGKFPAQAVSIMANIVENAEDEGLDRIRPLTTTPRTRGGAITKAAQDIGEHIGASFLIAFTQSGDSARRLARLRSPLTTKAFTPLLSTHRQLQLTWGVQSFLLDDPPRFTDEMVREVDEALLEDKLAEVGDVCVIVAGSPPGIPGSTNALRVHTVGDAVSRVAQAYTAEFAAAAE